MRSLSVHITTSPFGLTWHDAGDCSTWIAKDLAFRSYCHDPVHGTRWHYQQQPAKSYLYCLGERTGRLNLAGRRFRLERTDPMGYDSEHQDPLYKFSPFYLGLSLSNASTCARAYGMYYHQLGQTTLDLGQERDAVITLPKKKKKKR
ncbi:hypothetical protein DM01DRAFT_1222072 [Hesseltinella vesiculosa]|uniref:Glycoside hydrolase family 31 N-terminal domain-containing protein n=1 Tax=Hesseltinella vesiculosa TaxID=101127 RepID=A0A1X2GPC9_9FUNG|nr:hypothetical protein DM01DRAFT_1222072 [Hesseltinella vesiculosa]